MRSALLIFLVALVIAFAVSAQSHRVLRLVWDANDPEEEAQYIIYSAPEAAGPWSKVAHLSETTWTITAVGERMFYYVTASNAWGESDPSHVTNTPCRAGLVRSMQIK
jgi:hypothetical protein